MRVSKYIHACLLIEEEGERILFDPGKFSFIEGRVEPGEFRDLSAVVLTHRHPDHFDDEAIKKIVENNPSAAVLTNGEIESQLGGQGIKAEVFETGRREVGKFGLEAIGAEHAPILNAETPRNIAYVVNGRLLHPGDSFDRSLDACRGIELLALPVMAPWTTELQVAEFARRVSPKHAVPIHDGYAKEFFLKQRYENFRKYFAQLGIDFHPLSEPGESFEL